MKTASAVALFLFVLVRSGGGDLPDEPFARDELRGLMHAVQADRIRRAAVDDPASVPDTGMLSPSAADAWRAMFAGGPSGANALRPPEFLSEQISGFFAGAAVLPGPFDARGAVFAYWNPFWDALLFVRTAGGSLPESNAASAPPPSGSSGNFLLDEFADSAGSAAEPPLPSGLRGTPPKVQEFAWLSGETFRGEPLEQGPARVRTVVPSGDDPLSVSLWRVQAATVARFRERFGIGRPELFENGVLRADPVAEWAAIQSRAGLRLKTAALLLRDSTNAAVAARCCSLLRSGSERDLLRFFDDRSGRFFCRTLAKLPPAARNGFEPYGFVPGPEGNLFLFVNADMPRFYATVSFPKDRLSGPFAGAVQMEWYDLDRADELLGAIAGDAGKEKEDAR